MKKMFIVVFAAVACCFALSPTPYTGQLENLSIGTFGIEDYSYLFGNNKSNLKHNVELATRFRTRLEDHICTNKDYKNTTFEGSYSNTTSSDVTVDEFARQIKNGNYNIVFFSGHGGDGNGIDNDGNSIVTHNIALMYDDVLFVEDMEFSKETYFAFFNACNFLSFYTDRKGRDVYGFYKKKKNGIPYVVKESIMEYSEGDDDGWDDSKEAKPQYLDYPKFKKAFKNGLHGMLGFSSIAYLLTKDNKKYLDPSLYDTFAKKWIDDGLRIWQAFKYAVWKTVYFERSRGIEPAVIFRSGTAIDNKGIKRQFKGYAEYYGSIYQYSMAVNSLSSLSLGRKKAVYGHPEY